MKYQFFKVPIDHSDTAAQALNRFIASHKVLAIDKQWVATESIVFGLFAEPSGIKLEHNRKPNWRQLLK